MSLTMTKAAMLMLLCLVAVQVQADEGTAIDAESYNALLTENRDLQARVAELQLQMSQNKKSASEMLDAIQAREAYLRGAMDGERQEHKMQIEVCRESNERCRKTVRECEVASEHNRRNASDVAVRSFENVETCQASLGMELRSCTMDKEVMEKRIQEFELIISNGSQNISPFQSNEKIAPRSMDVNVQAARLAQANTVELGGRQYLFVTKQMANWFEAATYCSLLGMSLLSIETERENDLVMQQVEKLGMQREWIFTGGNKIGQSNYAWASGQPLTYDDWARGQPDAFKSEHCLILWNGDWFDLPCATQVRFICEQL